jgi:hypothetical protein
MQTIFHRKSVDTTSLHTEWHIPSSYAPSVIASKPKARSTFLLAANLLCNAAQTNFNLFQRSVAAKNFMTLQ